MVFACSLPLIRICTPSLFSLLHFSHSPLLYSTLCPMSTRIPPYAGTLAGANSCENYWVDNSVSSYRILSVSLHDRRARNSSGLDAIATGATGALSSAIHFTIAIMADPVPAHFPPTPLDDYNYPILETAHAPQFHSSTLEPVTTHPTRNVSIPM